MIFKIADGREYFYQWDIDRQIIVSDLTIKEVHFCNRTDDCSLVVEVVDGVANVPNIILQKSFDVRVFGYDGKATLHEATFKVKARTQPADYVYTETVVKSIEEILEAAETVTTTANEFYEFVEDHTLGLTDDGEGNVALTAVGAEEDINLTNYYTKAEVDELIENIDIPETDLTGYATETYVDEAVKNVKVDVDLTDYAKKTDIPDVSDFISEIPDEYITESKLNAKGYATKAELNDKANSNHTHSEYAKTTHTHSTADVDGLQKALNDKATQADIDKAIELHDHRYDYAPIDHNHGDEYAAKSHTHSYNNLLDKPAIPSVEGLATEKYVDDAIANIEIPVGPGGDVDLSDYYTKEETDELISGINQCDTYFFNAEAVEWSTGRNHTPAPASLAEFAQRLLAGEAVNLCVAQIVAGNVRWVAAEFAITKVNDVLCVEFVQGVSVIDIGKEDILQMYRVYPEATVGWAVAKTASFAEFIADKTYVDTAIQNALSGIAQAEGGAY